MSLSALARTESLCVRVNQDERVWLFQNHDEEPDLLLLRIRFLDDEDECES